MKVYAAEIAESPDMIRIRGTVNQVQGPRVSINRTDPAAYGQELILNITEGYTKILDAVTGEPVPAESLEPGQLIYAYIGPAMTLSLPPIANAVMILTDIPENYRVPDYAMVHIMELNDAQDGGILTTEDGSLYEITPDTRLFPYLTRNIVTIHDLTPGRMVLIWSRRNNDRAVKVMLFPESGSSGHMDDMGNIGDMAGAPGTNGGEVDLTAPGTPGEMAPASNGMNGQEGDVNSPVNPANGQSSPQGTPASPEAPGDIMGAPDDMTGTPGGMAGTPDGMAAVPGGMAEAPGGMAEAPGGMAAVPGGMAEAPGGMAAVPGGMAGAPGGIAEAPGGMAAVPGGMTGAPDNMAESPNGMPEASNGTAQSPISTPAGPEEGPVEEQPVPEEEDFEPLEEGTAGTPPTAGGGSNGLFPGGQVVADGNLTLDQEPYIPTGWIERNGLWYYYDSNGAPYTGWLDDQGTWYYLDPESGAMHTGFLTLDGNTYFLEEDGRLLTSPRIFSPDESGALH